MSDPIRLKLLPWRPLLNFYPHDFYRFHPGTVISFAQSTFIRNTITMLYSPFGILMSIAIAVGIGALTVYLCERWLPQVLNTSSLWALVLCLLLALKVTATPPSLLIDLSDFGLIGEIRF